MSDIVLRSLADVDPASIVAVFNASFRDYAVTIEFDVERLLLMMAARSVDLNLSLGAFEGGELVAFVLNGSRDLDGVRVGYDAGTGVVPRARGRGLARRLMQCTIENLGATGHDRYLLEVLESNEAARSLYESLGFRITRRLVCFEGTARVEGTATTSQRDSGRVRTGELSDVAPLLRLRRERPMWFEPTWQNADTAVAAFGARCSLVEVLDPAGRSRAWCVVERSSGSILQFAWSADAPGDAQVLLAAAAGVAATASIRCVNVDLGAPAAVAGLAEAGLVETVRQWEMARTPLHG